MFPYLQHVASKIAMLIYIKPAERERSWSTVLGMFYARPGNGAHHLSSHSVGRNLVTWLHPTAREAGRCSLSMCPGRRGNWPLLGGERSQVLSRGTAATVFTVLSHFCNSLPEALKKETSVPFLKTVILLRAMYQTGSPYDPGPH